MGSKTRRILTVNGETGEDSVLATMVRNGEELEPMVSLAFETGKPEALVQSNKHLVEIEDHCKLHYNIFGFAVDELRGVLVDAEEL